MRKFLGLAVVIALLSFVSSAHAGTAVSDKYADQERYVGEVVNIMIEGQDISSDGSQVTILANGHMNNATTPASQSDSSNLESADIAFGIHIFADIGNLGVGAGSDGPTVRSVSLVAGTPGQMITFVLLADSGGTLYITDDQLSPAGQAAVVETGWDDIAFDSALDSVTLLYVDDTYGWVLIGGNSVTIT